MATPNIETIIRDRVTLTIDCIDRLYLNGYVPTLQTSGQLCWYLKEHLGNPIPSPALLRPLHDRFVRDVAAFADSGKIPVVHFERGQRKDEVAAEHRARFTKAEGVVFIGVAQERASAFKAQKQTGPQGGVHFDFSRQSVAVNHYYFYVQDREWGPGFVKVGTYFPYPVRICLNGHEWAKQQARQVGLTFTSLDNGFLACDDPARLQAICDGLGPADVQRFFARWQAHLPWPLTAVDRAAGYRHRLSIWQLEVSRTQVFDRPVQGRHFFEAVIRENLDLGRPDRVSLLFPTRLTRRTPAPAHGYRTRVITTGIAPSLHVAYKHTDVKQYFKEERALRTETTINDPTDFQSKKALETLPQLRATGTRINQQVLTVERVSHACSLSQDALAQLQTPRQQDGHRIPALRFGDPRVLALLQALCRFAHLPTGFRNRDLRPDVAALLGRDRATYSRGAMTYDLRRLRLHGLIERVPRTHRYTLTSFGLHVAFFCSKLHLRILRPAAAALVDPPNDLPHPLRDALRLLDQAIDQLCAAAQLHPEAA
ncbi:hypothetical protein [Actinocrinis sp.]|uniref:hypothetical protein n=1 Tax=Actinocrinis sp. TaxID=1920516 RepID=UPI002D6B2B29|nr:hypothetical protein [Actinocrinis sp.]HZP54417.1 hypothetical protein [Actinocrinis sp.]